MKRTTEKSRHVTAIISAVRFTDYKFFHSDPSSKEVVSKLCFPAPKARNVKAWAIGPGAVLDVAER